MPFIVNLPRSLPEEFIQAIIDLEVLTESKAFLLILDKSIDRNLATKIQSLRKDLFSIKKLIVIIDSGGGDINAAHKILQFLREENRKMEVYVNEYAKSAATFLCLGADMIIMHKNAEMGPLDPQIKEPGGRRFISALDRSKSTDYLRNHAIETFDIMVGVILGRTDFSIKEAIDEAHKFTRNICEPLYAKEDPDKLGEYSRLIAIGEEYTRRAMLRYGYAGRKPEEINKIIKQIVYGYPSHSFIIDYKEAQDLGLNVRLPSKEEEPLMDKIASFLGKIQCVGTISPVEKAEPNKEGRINGKAALENKTTASIRA